MNPDRTLGRSCAAERRRTGGLGLAAPRPRTSCRHRVRVKAVTGGSPGRFMDGRPWGSERLGLCPLGGVERPRRTQVAKRQSWPNRDQPVARSRPIGAWAVTGQSDRRQQHHL